MSASVAPHLVLRTAHIALRVTRRQTDRCYGLLRSAGDVWAWLLDGNRQRHQQGEQPVVNYQALCRQLTSKGSFGELSVVGARSVLRRYADAWHQAAKRRQGGEHAGFPRRKRSLVPVRFYSNTSQLDGRRVRQAHHQAAKKVIEFLTKRRVGTLLVGDPKGITSRDVGRVQNLRLRQWRRDHLMQVLCDKSKQAGITVFRVD